MKYYIIAGEASGDLHGSNLISEIKNKDPKASFRCWGGDLMKASGGNLVKHFKDLSFMGFWEVFINLNTILKNLRFCKKDIVLFNPDAIIYIDYPGFNLRIAKWAKKKSFNNHYYISPQIWAWKERRVNIIKKYINSLYVILPFEKEFYKKKHNYSVKFVGHPLMDHIPNKKLNKSFIEEIKLNTNMAIIALLPGSRKQEIKKILPVFLKVSEKFKNKQFVIAGSPGIDKEFYNSIIKKSSVKIIFKKTYDLLQHSEAALITSGTATLEAALFNVPQIVCYKTSIISYLIAKKIVKLKYISLVNLIFNKEVVKELIQKNCSEKLIENELKRLLSKKGREALSKSYKLLFKSLGNSGASKRTAELIVNSIK
jgi:lipid-A-disaccharide synthase